MISMFGVTLPLQCRYTRDIVWHASAAAYKVLFSNSEGILSSSDVKSQIQVTETYGIIWKMLINS